MPVSASRTGSTGTVTITINVADILAMVILSAEEKRIRAFQRAAEELSRAIEALRTTQAQRDQRVLAVQEQNAAITSAAPTGNL